MRGHWNGFFAFVGLALVGYMTSMMYERYGLAVAFMLGTLFLGSAYAIGLARFRGRPDPPDEQRRSAEHRSARQSF